jgi:hypothetical protein
MNTATNAVETQNAAAGAAVDQIKDVLEGGENNTASTENAAPVVTELDNLNALFENPKATLRGFEQYTNLGLLDENLVKDLVDLSEKIIAHSNPDSRKAEIEALKKQAAALFLKPNATEETFAVMLQVQELESKQKTEGAGIREKLGADVKFKSVLMAFQDEFAELVEYEAIKFLLKHRNSKWKHGRVSKDGTPKAATNAGPVETITFEVKGVTHTVKAGKGRLTTEIAAVAEEHAKAVKDEAAKTKPVFIQALKDGKVKGAKVTKVETV